MPYKSQMQTVKYRVIVEEYRTWTETPTREEVEAPRNSEDKSPLPKEQERGEWVVTDETTSTKKTVIAGYLRSVAQEYDPPKTITRDY